MAWLRKRISCGRDHSLACNDDGTAVATGDNVSGECDVGGWTNIIQVAAGERHSLGLKEDGTAVATGGNGDGQCDVGGWTNIIQVAAGAFHSLGLKEDGTVVATGGNSDGQSDVGGWTNIIQVAAGEGHSLGLKEDGTVVATGGNSDGQSDVGGWTNIIQVAGGEGHSLGLEEDGTVVATGNNVSGECDVGGWTNIIQVAAGEGHSLGLKEDGTAVATGDNYDGQCDVGSWTNIIQVAGNGNHSLGLKEDGTVVATGDNVEGQTNVGGWTNIIQVAAGGGHSLGLEEDGTVVATGNNDEGQCNVSSWDLLESDISINDLVPPSGSPKSALTIVTSDSPTNIDHESATLEGTLQEIANDSARDVYFEWGTDTSYGNTTDTQTISSVPSSFSADISGLNADTAYHYRSVVTDGSEYFYGNDVSFTTEPPPVVATDLATNITDTSATLNGTLQDLIGNSSLDVRFEYGLDTTYGNTTSWQNKSDTVSFSADITGLTTFSEYHFRAVASDGSTTWYGDDSTFFAVDKPQSGLLGNKRLATTVLGFPDWGVTSAVTTDITATSPLPYEELVTNVIPQSSAITIRDLEDLDEFAEAWDEGGPISSVMTVNQTTDAWLAAIGGNVNLGGSEVEGAKVFIIRNSDNAIATTTTTDSNGRFDVVVDGREVYHVAIQYEASDGTKYNAKSKPYIDTWDP